MILMCISTLICMFYENKLISSLLYAINFQDFDLATKLIDLLMCALDKLSAKCINVYVKLCKCIPRF